MGVKSKFTVYQYFNGAFTFCGEGKRHLRVAVCTGHLLPTSLGLQGFNKVTEKMVPGEGRILESRQCHLWLKLRNDIGNALEIFLRSMSFTIELG